MYHPMRSGTRFAAEQYDKSSCADFSTFLKTYSSFRGKRLLRAPNSSTNWLEARCESLESLVRSSSESNEEIASCVGEGML